MKSLLLIVSVLALFIAVSMAAEAIGIYNDPRYPGKCAVRENLILSPGDEVKDPNAPCARIFCGKNGYTTFQTCGVQSIQGCRLGDYVDTSLPYPDCCKRHIICD